MQSPYNISSDTQGYYFITEQGVKYRLVFENLDQLFSQYPTLHGRVFSFSFYPLEGITLSVKADVRVKQTIASAISRFFAKRENLIVFVCDSTDKREEHRKKLFDKWFDELNDGRLEKYDGVIQSEDLIIINTIILRSDLSDKQHVLDIFRSLNDEFSRAK